MRALLLCGLPLALAACGEGGSENVAASASSYQAQLLAMEEGQRNAVFIRAIRDAGQDCQQVVSSTLEGQDASPVWTARCDNGSVWAIAIAQGGIAQVTPIGATVAGNSSLP